MKITTEMKQGVLIVQLEGELDMHVADEFRQEVDKALDASGVRNILLNLDKVTFIDSSGLGVILGRYKRISLQGGRMLAIQVRPQVARIMELSGLLKIVGIYKTEAEALGSL